MTSPRTRSGRPLIRFGCRQAATIVCGIVSLMLCAHRSALAQTKLLSAANESTAVCDFVVLEKADRLIVSNAGTPVIEFVFRDEKILRPYFSNARTPSGLQVTRNHPPQSGIDATDHDTMHPGIWLAFGDINGQDFWRNKARIEHVRFVHRPTVSSDRVTFTTESNLVSADGQTHIGQLISRFRVAAQAGSWLLVWDATLKADDRDLLLGDQEEMGFGVRMATLLTEKKGGRIVNSAGQPGAAATWGQAAAWCDYSGTLEGKSCGVTLITAPDNFRSSWWHNRDYGLMVANPFGRAAMKQGAPSVVTVKRGDELQLRFAAFLHDAVPYEPASAYEQFLRAR
jgi:hypothetical protein